MDTSDYRPPDDDFADHRDFAPGTTVRQAIIAKAIRQRRMKLGLTQEQLAFLADLSEGSIRNLETGTVEPRSKTLNLVQAVLGWAPGSLTEFVDIKQPVEIVPFEMLEHIVIELIFGQETTSGTRSAARDFRNMMSEVDEHGEFAAEAAKKFVGVIFDLGLMVVSANAEYERTDEEDFVIVNDGGYEHHKKFVKDLESSLKVAEAPAPEVQHHTGSGKTASLPPLQAKFQIKNRSTHEAELSTGSLPIPKELFETLGRTQVIDHLMTTPQSDDENLVVVAVLVKRDTNRPLSPRDVETLKDFQVMKEVGVIGPWMEDPDAVAHDQTEA